MNIYAHILYVLIAVAFGYTLGFHRGVLLCKPSWIELKIHKRRVKTKWPKEIEAKEKIEE